MSPDINNNLPPGYEVGFFAGDNDWRWKTRNAAAFGFVTEAEAVAAAWAHFDDGALVPPSESGGADAAP